VVPVPNIAYSNRISLAIKAQTNTAYSEFVAMNQPMVEINPSMLDNIDSDQAFRDGWRNAGLPEDSLIDKEEVEQIRAARAEAAQAQAAMEQAQQAATIAKDVSAANGGEMPDMSQMAPQ
jgi:hypothetical protein